AGAPATHMYVILEGEIQGHRESEAGERVFTARAGEVTGILPFSRLKTLPATVRAVGFARVAALHKEHFHEMLTRIPLLVKRLVGVMSDRIRESAKADQQREKLAALGKLSAGLAHELNNPAAAAQRAAATLCDAVNYFRDANWRLDEQDLSREQRRTLADFERATGSRAGKPEPIDSLERSDREEALAQWLQSRGVENAWKLAPHLVSAGLDSAALTPVADALPPEALRDALMRIAASSALVRLVAEIENSVSRISELVRAIKEYSYMDQGPEQEIDIHQGLESTLLMLTHQLKHGVNVVREYDRSLPKFRARGSELNQVWTNLIDNAIDAMNGNGELRIRTSRELDYLLVEIRDNGVGIPPEIQSRIFEPFFTTKGVGEGTGLGLETAYRIVRNHHGEITFASKPGATSFEVRLPLN
ncbi:MAG: ATP-binding protein, partial [Bryobacteraceae bacterium]